MRRIVVVMVLMMALCMGSSCGGGGASGDTAGVDSLATPRVWRIGYVPMVDALPLIVAHERGMTSEEQLPMELVAFRSQMDIDTALVGGSVDGAFTDVFRVAMMEEKYGVSLRVLTVTAAQWTLVSNKVARITQLEQMGDKMVGMCRFSATDWLTEETFRRVKTTAQHFKVQINDVALRLQMLDNNEMDAIWLPEPYATTALLHGHKRLATSETLGKNLGVLVVRQDTTNIAAVDSLSMQLTQVYAMACDTINKHGVKSYLRELREYCHVDTAVVTHLPEITYPAVSPPSEALVNEAKTFLTERQNSPVQ